MPSSFNHRVPANTPGKYYVTADCTDCDLCREIAPTVFVRNASEGTSYVAKQPVTAEELELTIESMEGCPCEAIHNDGDHYDWATAPEPGPIDLDVVKTRLPPLRRKQTTLVEVLDLIPSPPAMAAPPL